MRGAGVVHENVEATVFADRRGDEMRGTVLGRNVAGQTERFAAGRLDPRDERVQSPPAGVGARHGVIVVDSHRRHVRRDDDEPVPRQTLRDRCADAVLLAAAGDQRHALVGFSHNFRPFDIRLEL